MSETKREAAERTTLSKMSLLFHQKGTLKKQMEKETKNELQLKKVSLTPLSLFRPPQDGLLEKSVPEQ